MRIDDKKFNEKHLMVSSSIVTRVCDYYLSTEIDFIISKLRRFIYFRKMLRMKEKYPELPMMSSEELERLKLSTAGRWAQLKLELFGELKKDNQKVS